MIAKVTSLIEGVSQTRHEPEAPPKDESDPETQGSCFNCDIFTGTEALLFKAALSLITEQELLKDKLETLSYIQSKLFAQSSNCCWFLTCSKFGCRLQTV